MKVVKFEPESMSLVVSFASDETQSSDPSDYVAHSYQPSMMWPNVTDIEELKLHLAVSGLFHIENQKRVETLKNDPIKNALYESMVDQVYDVPASVIEGSSSIQDIEVKNNVDWTRAVVLAILSEEGLIK
jgi:hypothetical protein